jgi:diacylglycerol kinase (ATP)
MKDNQTKEKEYPFYKRINGAIPMDIISDFIDDTNFLLIFVNPISGSQEGKIILDYVDKYREPSIRNYNIIHFPVEEQNDWFPTPLSRSRSNSIQSFDEIKIKGSEHPSKFDPSIPFSIIIFNVIEKEDYIKGKQFIKSYINDFTDNNIKILIGGGDGSVLSIIEDLYNDKINLEKCIFGAMPLGTGNDLSNAMGFDSTCQIGLIEYFQRVLYSYLTSSVVKNDIWKLELKVDKNEGKIFDIIDNGEIELKDNNNKDLTYFKKTFINYMSIGFDAKVGFMFGQKRTSSRIFNKIIYAWEATKYMLRALFRKSLGLTSLLESFISLENEDIDNHLLPNNENYFIDVGSLTNKKIIFETTDSIKKKNYYPIILKGNPIVIICQNIDFYGGGTQNIWGSTEKIGIQACKLKRKEKKIFENNIANSFHDQSSNDKQIEFCTYNYGMQMGLDRVTGGRANKICQGFGPFCFTFKKILSKSQKKRLNRVYINIDGEFYHLVQPKQIIISLDKKICNGQIKFLKNELAIWKLKQKTIFQKMKKKVKYYKYILTTIFICIILYWKHDIRTIIIIIAYLILLFL